MLKNPSDLLRLIYQWVEPNLSRFNTDRQLQVWLVAVLVGFAVSLATIVFRELIGLVQWTWLMERSENVLSAVENVPWYYVLLAPVVGGAIVGWMLENLLPQRRAGGVSDVMESRVVHGKDVELQPALMSAAVTAVSLGAGASAGREGPMVHLAAGLSTALIRKFNLPSWSRNTLLASGVAAAVSASFNAPIAGVLFAHEIILGHYARRSFVPIVIAAVGGTIFSRLWFGDVAAFVVPEYQITSYWEFPAFALLGLVCAFISVIFQFAIVGTDYVARNVHIDLFYRPIIGGLLIGLIALMYPQILGVGYEATDQALKNELGLSLMISLIVAKIAATSITLASRFGGGVFSPALYLGALTGGAFGLIATGMFPELSSSDGLYAILGMGAVAAAVLGAPFSTTMIVFELTGGYTLTIALLLAVSISTGINQAIHGHSFFEWQLEMRGIFLGDGPHRYLMRSIKVSDFMVKSEDQNEIQTLETDDDGNLPQHLKSTDNLETALRSFDESGIPSLPVIEGQKMQVVAQASQNDALRTFNSELCAASEEEHRG